MDEWGPVNVTMLYDHDRTRLRECHSPTPVPPPLFFLSLPVPDNAHENLLVLKNLGD